MSKILVAGDFCPRERVQTALNNGCYSSLFDSVRPLFRNADYAIVNFESTVSEDGDELIPKQGAHLGTTPASIDLLSDLGINMVTLANNHFMDFGVSAYKRSISLLKKKGIEYVGAGSNIQEASQTKIISIEGGKYAFINVCEHEFSVATENTPGCHPLDPMAQSYLIKDAKQQADYVIMIVHGGNEHYQLPSPRMKRTYRFFVDCGADAIINHHQHCYSGYEIYKGKPIFYGLGNFCFDSKSDIKYRHSTFNYGCLVTLDFSPSGINFQLHPYEQCYQKPGVFLLDKEDTTRFFSNIDELNVVICDDKKLKDSYDRMALERHGYVTQPFKPYSSKLLYRASCKGWVPSFLTKKRLYGIKAIVTCESHYDVLMSYLGQLFKH